MRAFNDWELDLDVNLLRTLQKDSISLDLYKVIWKGAKAECYSVREAYMVLHLSVCSPFLVKGIWLPCAPLKTTFYVWNLLGDKVPFFF